MSIQKDIPELVKAGIISQITADQIQTFYKNKSSSAPNKLLVVFGILGAILVGLGIILMIAHNWDELSRATKTIFAFIPLMVAQITCGYVLLKKRNNTAWREGATSFLFFAVGACIALVSQIYHIPGNISSFLLIWMLLCMPLIYVMKSSMATLLYLVGITYYAAETGYFAYPSTQPYLYIFLLLTVLPHYYLLLKNWPKSNFLVLENLFIPFSITIVLGSFAIRYGQFLFIAYFSLFGLFYAIGNTEFFQNQSLKNNAYKIIGSAGSLTLLFVASFSGFWHDIISTEYELIDIWKTPEFWTATVITISAIGYLYYRQKNKSWRQIHPLSIIFILYIICYTIGRFSSISVLLINLIIFALSILTIIEGAKQEHFGILNFGLSIITILIICRFLDSNLSFVIRGLLLMIIGIGFFVANYWMLKKRKINE